MWTIRFLKKKNCKQAKQAFEILASDTLVPVVETLKAEHEHALNWL